MREKLKETKKNIYIKRCFMMNFKNSSQINIFIRSIVPQHFNYIVSHDLFCTRFVSI